MIIVKNNFYLKEITVLNTELVITYESGVESRFPINRDSDNGLKYIKEDSGAPHYLIEDVSDYFSIAKPGDKKYNFIFLCKFEIKNNTFNHNPGFENALFTKEVVIRDCSFKKEVSFKKSVFRQKLILADCTFKDKVEFISARIDKIAVIHNSNFFERVFFRYSKFNHLTLSRLTVEKEFEIKDATLRNIEMKQVISAEYFNFDKSKIEGYFKVNNSSFLGLCLDEVQFNGSLNIKKTKLEKLSLNDMIIYDMVLDLKALTVDRIENDGVDFNEINISNRETCVILKEAAEKKQDKIKAMGFYQREMTFHRKELKDKRTGLQDRFILWFQKTSSDYGTNPLKALGWLLLINTLFLVGFLVFQNYTLTQGVAVTVNDFTLMFSKLFSISLKIEDVLGEYYKDIQYVGWMNLLNTLRNIISGILIYQAIKSFRKFSK